MKKGQVKNLYEKFHLETGVQKKIIDRNNFTYRFTIEMIDKYVKSTDTVLDVGCGAGTVSFYIANKGCNVHGVDISESAIESCIASTKYLNLKNATFEVMNYPVKTPERKFDVIILTEVLEHLQDDEEALKKIFLNLKKGGRAIISTPSINAPLYRMGYASGFDKRVGHLRRYSMEKLVKKSKEQGFVILEKKKIEGIIRNFLFVSPSAGKLVRFVKFFLSDMVTILDNLSLEIFGESNIIVVVRKP